jgi:hypothetical protein
MFALDVLLGDECPLLIHTYVQISNFYVVRFLDFDVVRFLIDRQRENEREREKEKE